MRYDYAQWRVAVEKANACIIPSYDEMRAEARKRSPYEREKMFDAWSLRRHEMAEWFYHSAHTLPAF